MRRKTITHVLQMNLKALPVGFHRRRIGGKGVGFEAYVWRGGKGPILLVNGGTHGDEYEGPTLLMQWAQRWRPRELSGTVVLVPVLNEVAFFSGSRNRPDDGKNLARSFPGRSNGLPTSRLARLFDEQLLSQCTHYIDLHSAGAAYELIPWVGYMTGGPAPVERCQQAMATCFDRFWCWSGPYLPGRTLSAAAVRCIPAIYAECRGAGDVAPRDLVSLNMGLRRTMAFLGLVRGRPTTLRSQPTRLTVSARETHLQVHHKAPRDGLFAPLVRLGATVRKGMVIGEVLGLSSGAYEIRSEDTGRVVMIRVQRSVLRGDPLFVVAPI